jgi:tetratricopeptide (TPR) repeat protein
LWRGVFGLRHSAGNTQLVLATFFAAWVTYQSQSLLSIDNVGIAIWGWTLGGGVVGLSQKSLREGLQSVDGKKLSPKVKARLGRKSLSSNQVTAAQPLISALLLIIAITMCIPMYLSDGALRTLRSYAKPNSSQLQAYVQLARKPLGYGIQDPQTKVAVALLIAEAGKIPEAKVDLGAVLASDQRSFDALHYLASIDEQTSNLPAAIRYRRALVKIDPWNYISLLQLGEDLKKSGDVAGAKAIVSQIDRFASHTPQSATAHKDLGA